MSIPSPRTCSRPSSRCFTTDCFFTSDLDPGSSLLSFIIILVLFFLNHNPFFFESNDTTKSAEPSIYLNDLSNKSFGLLFFNGFSFRRIANSLSLPVVFFTLPAFRLSCLSSTLLDIIVPSCSTLKDIITSLSFSFCYCFWWNFSFEAPKALDLPISAAAASVVTLVALLACTGAKHYCVVFELYMEFVCVMRTCIDTDHSLTSCIFISHM